MRSFSCLWLAFFIIIGLCACDGGVQTPAPPPDCNTALISLLPCLDYVQGNVSTPPKNCCIGLGSVVQSNPVCLCTLFNSSALPIQVNTTRALQLPAVCNVNTPNPSICGGTVAPVKGPVPSPPVSTPAPSTTAPPTPKPPTTAPATPPTVPPPTATPPLAATTPATSTPVVPPSAHTTPSIAPLKPTTPSLAPSTIPSVAPSVAPVVAPSAPTPVPASGPPAPAPSSAATLAPTPTTAKKHVPSVSSPPAPPPANENNAAAFATASVLSVIIAVSSILFLQL